VVAPPTKVDLASVSPVTVGAVTLRVAVPVLPFHAAPMDVEVLAVDAVVVTVKAPVVAPAATPTEAGTVAAAVLLFVSGIVIPPAGAAELRVIVPVEVAPPSSVAGFMTSVEMDGPFTVRVADTVEESKAAVMCATPLVPTTGVVTVKVVEV
jgi:hypothetical protein